MPQSGVRAAAAVRPADNVSVQNVSGQNVSGQVEPLQVEAAPATPPVPTTAEVKAAIPAHCMERNFWRAAPYAVTSLILTFGSGVLAWLFIPLHWSWAPMWILYAVVVGTFSNGVWVIAHECGHRAFSNGTRLQDAVGFVLHSALLVPYFSWQRSHAIHHAKTNHLTEGETHVPARLDTEKGERMVATHRRFGPRTHGVLTATGRLIAGWPLYLVMGVTGGPERGVTNHFWPARPFSDALFPNRWAQKVKLSAVGVLVTLALLAAWSIAVGSLWPVLALYVGPYLVGNMWLVAYTWLQHTDEDIPHYADEEWSFVRGAFCSVDRPYGRVINFLHHNIGSTHVAHHLDAKIPHYRAAEATRAIADAFPDLYRFDPTPVPLALWRVARNCHVVEPTADGWRFAELGKSGATG